MYTFLISPILLLDAHLILLDLVVIMKPLPIF